MDITIRKAVKEDCARMMELVQELAIYEKAPDEVTVSLDHFRGKWFWRKPCMVGLCSRDEREGGGLLRCITFVTAPGKDNGCTSKT
jgi:hypothetical protein